MSFSRTQSGNRKRNNHVRKTPNVLAIKLTKNKLDSGD